MARTQNALKNIVCLESLWNEAIESRLSMQPIADVIAKTYGIEVVYLSCNTRSEFEFNLKLVQKTNFDILYLAFHGESDAIELPDETSLSLTDLAAILKKRFAGWIVYFGSCGTCDVEEERLAWFRRETGVVAVMGYTQTVDWIESAALDMIVLAWLQEYKDLSAMMKRINQDYPDLVERLGFVSSP